MVTNFECETEDLTDKELDLLEEVKAAFIWAFSKYPKLKHESLELWVNQDLSERGIQHQVKGVRLRKFINYFRTRSILPVLADSKGYWLSYDKNELWSQIQSLEERANSIMAAANGLKSICAVTGS